MTKHHACMCRSSRFVCRVHTHAPDTSHELGGSRSYVVLQAEHHRRGYVRSSHRQRSTHVCRTLTFEAKKRKKSTKKKTNEYSSKYYFLEKKMVCREGEGRTLGATSVQSSNRQYFQIRSISRDRGSLDSSLSARNRSVYHHSLG